MGRGATDEKVFNTLSLRKVLFPVAIGVAVIVLMIIRDPDFRLANLLLIRDINIIAFLGALSMLFIRDFLYTIRVRLLTDSKLSWWSCFEIIALWEFSSAVTPSAVGGGFVAVFLFMKHGVSFGRSIAYVMITSTFDNIFFLLASPYSYFKLMQNTKFYNDNFWLFASFWLSYALIFLYASIMLSALFVKPDFFSGLLKKITSLPFLNKWHAAAIKQGNEIVIASKVLKKKGGGFWVLILVVTLCTWFSRYAILNFLIAGFVKCSFSTHVDILCKHLMMWITMLISPTPGGSGLIEYCFSFFYKDMLANYAIVISIIWRTLTYYVYLIVGASILPGWIRTVKNKKHVQNK